jgi:hypothetical protein
VKDKEEQRKRKKTKYERERGMDKETVDNERVRERQSER